MSLQAVRVSNSADGIEVAIATRVDDELGAAFGRLIPQLSRSARVPTPDLIREVVEAQASTVLIARDLRDNGRIVGMLTLIVFCPTRQQCVPVHPVIESNVD